jgi:glycosyltransferase involved in cell wall biosynthesis
MRIAIFDYLTIRNNPTGGCNIQLLAGLCQEHEFTVFSAAFDNPCPERIRWIRVPVPRRPLALLFLAFHIIAGFCLLWYRLRGGKPFDVVQTGESNLLFGDVCYVHFCHRAFLRNHWKRVRTRGVRGAFRWLDHWLHAMLEPVVYRRRKLLVVPSRGLAEELSKEYPAVCGKVKVIPNPVDVAKMRQPEDFDRRAFRARLGIDEDETVLLFCALGHFERKGLPLLLAALQEFQDVRWKLIVVGGEADTVAAYRRISRSDRIIYAGMQSDVRPFLWASEAFVLPSAYETFSLVTFEAAAAGVPPVVPRLYGIEDFLRDGENGIYLVRTDAGVKAALKRFFSLDSATLRRMGQQARCDVDSYSAPAFVQHWSWLYERVTVDLQSAGGSANRCSIHVPAAKTGNVVQIRHKPSETGPLNE